MARERAEELASKALLYLAADERLVQRFLAESGLDPAAIRRAARDKDFLSGVLDFMMANEMALLAFAESAGCEPGEVERAAQLLARAGRAADAR